MKVEKRNKEIKDNSFLIGSQCVIKMIEDMKIPKLERRNKLLIILIKGI